MQDSTEETAAREQSKRDLSERAMKARTQFFSIWSGIGVLALAFVALKILGLLSGTVAILVLTLLIVVCLQDIVSWFEARGVKRFLGVVIAFIVMFAVVALIGLLIFSPTFGLSNRLNDFMDTIPAYLDDLGVLVDNLYTQYANLFESDVIKQAATDSLSSLSRTVSSAAHLSLSSIISLGASLMNAGLVLLFALVVSFWVLLELPALGRECKRIISPKYQEDAEMLHLTVSRVMRGFLRGTLFQSIIVGIASSVWFVLIDLPNAVALGVIMGIVNIVPVIGPWVGGIIAAVMGLFSSPLTAVLAVIGFIAIHGFVATFVYPRIMQGTVDAHPILVLIALMAGSALGSASGGVWGALVGMLFSIPIVAMMKSFFVYYFEKRTGRRVVSPDGVFFKGGYEGTDDDFDPMIDATCDHAPVKPIAETLGEIAELSEIKTSQELEAEAQAQAQAEAEAEAETQAQAEAQSRTEAKPQSRGKSKA